jgi:hypothetical protein
LEGKGLTIPKNPHLLSLTLIGIRSKGYYHTHITCTTDFHYYNLLKSGPHHTTQTLYTYITHIINHTNAPSEIHNTHFLDTIGKKLGVSLQAGDQLYLLQVLEALAVSVPSEHLGQAAIQSTAQRS